MSHSRRDIWYNALVPRIPRVLILAILLAVAACSGSDNSHSGQAANPDLPDAAVSIDSETGVSESESAEDAGESGLTSSGPEEGIAAVFNEVETLVRRMNRGDAQEIAECMHDTGFPQLLELQADSASNSTSSSSIQEGTISIQPYEMGPYTESQAREFGLVGSKHIGASREAQAGTAISNDPAYSRAYQSCRETSRGNYSSAEQKQIEALSQTMSDLRYAIQSQFKARSEPAITALLSDRIECLRNSGYGSIDFQNLDGSWEALLQQVGIRPGETRQVSQDGEEIDFSDLAEPLGPGETRLIPGSEMPIPEYYPSAAEIELALAYVECGERTDFLHRLDELQAPIRAEILSEYEFEILGL